MAQYWINRGILIALAKRWHNDHNNFHLATSEMTFSLEDVYRILRIPMVKELVIYDQTKQGGTDALRRIFLDNRINGYEIPW
jgi:hypothetical protein